MNLVNETAETSATVGDDPHARNPHAWAVIAEPARALLLEPRANPLSGATVAALLARAPFVEHAEGAPAAVRAALAPFGADLAADAGDLAERLAALLGVDRVRARVEAVLTDHCRKLHTDFVSLRLITSYAGAGTEHAPDGDPSRLERVPLGWVGLFKGRDYGEGHAACLHRSPPIATSDGVRLLLVLDPLPHRKPA